VCPQSFGQFEAQSPGTPARDLSSNAYVANKAELRLMKTLAMRARGATCFDFGFYARRNPDVAERARGSQEFLWEQFVKHGLHEGRVFRWDSSYCV
jgi:hypothetical protein